MGMSTHIKAFIPDTDPEYLKHKEILLVCNKHSVQLPPETSKYFDNLYPHMILLDNKLEINLELGLHYNRWADKEESSAGFEIDLTNLPKGVTKLRFYNNW